MTLVDIRSRWRLSQCAILVNGHRQMSGTKRWEDSMRTPGDRHMADWDVSFERAMGSNVTIESKGVLDVFIVKPVGGSGKSGVGSIGHCQTALVFEMRHVIALELTSTGVVRPVGQDAVDLKSAATIDADGSSEWR
jgi:hypothetical protein